MTYTDGLHLVADTLKELHTFARRIGLKRHFFHGTRKGHPYYDLTNKRIKKKVISKGATLIPIRKVLDISKNTIVLRTPYHSYTARKVKAIKGLDKKIARNWLHC